MKITKTQLKVLVKEALLKEQTPLVHRSRDLGRRIEKALEIENEALREIGIRTNKAKTQLTKLLVGQTVARITDSGETVYGEVEGIYPYSDENGLVNFDLGIDGGRYPITEISE